MSPEQARGKVGRFADRRLGVRVRALRDADAASARFAATMSPTRSSRSSAKTPTGRRFLRPRLASQPLLDAMPEERSEDNGSRSIGDARIHLDEVIEARPTRCFPRKRRRPGLIARVITSGRARSQRGAAVAALATWALTRPAPSNPALPVRFEIVPPQALPLSRRGVRTATSRFRPTGGTSSTSLVGPSATCRARASIGSRSIRFRASSMRIVPFFSPTANGSGIFEEDHAQAGRDHRRITGHGLRSPHRRRVERAGVVTATSCSPR